MFEFPLRFPGQYADKETGLNYNDARDYSAQLGRYIESDPLESRAASIHTPTLVIGHWSTSTPWAWSIGKASSAAVEQSLEWPAQSSGLILRRNASATEESESRVLQVRWLEELAQRPLRT